MYSKKIFIHNIVIAPYTPYTPRAIILISGLFTTHTTHNINIHVICGDGYRRRENIYSIVITSTTIYKRFVE